MIFFKDIYRGKKVFITGHSGFKGSWLLKWMEFLGADVKGYSLAPTTTPNHLDILKTKSKSILANIIEKNRLEKELLDFEPDIVFHLAAQPLVRYSYQAPHETFETNVMGTLNVLEACRKSKNIKAIVCVTTDKVYENHESEKGYDESDRLGGFDPYSSSKACAELLISSFSNSFFSIDKFGVEHSTLIASVRGGNVIGGGDWSEDRLIPDIVKAIVNNQTIEIRNPESVRPWQHVLDCLSGYILLGQHLLAGEKEFTGPWNFGPKESIGIKVSEIINIAQQEWEKLNVNYNSSDLHETKMLTLDTTKAKNHLNWMPILDDKTMFNWTFQWYKAFYTGTLSTEIQLQLYTELAKEQQVTWIQ